MKINRKVITILGIAIILFSLAAIMLMQRNSQKSLEQYPVRSFINSKINNEVPIVGQFSKTEFDKLPQELPLLQIDQLETITKDDAIQIAKQLGYRTDPTSYNDGLDGLVYTWFTDKDSLFIRVNKKVIEYALNEMPSLSPTQKRLSQAEAIQGAQNFLKDKHFPGISNLEYSFINYWKESAGQEGTRMTSISDAQVYHVNFTYKVAGQKIITDSPFTSPIIVTMSPTGEITSFGMTLYKNIKLTPIVYRLKTFAEFTNSLNNSKIINFDDGNLTNPDTVANPIQSVNVSSVELAYLLNSEKTGTFFPVYIISGKANITNIGSGLSVHLYLPALASSTASPTP